MVIFCNSGALARKAFAPGQGWRAFPGPKSGTWDTQRGTAKGYILDPKNTAKSVVLTEEGERRSRELFERHFGRKRQFPAPELSDRVRSGA